MMGTSLCKPCVKYASNCLQSSSSECSGSYTLKMRDDAKLWANKPRSSSISAGTTKISNSNNAVGFWNSWESLHRSNTEELKQQRQPSVRLTNKSNGNNSFTSMSVTNGLKRNLSYDAPRDVISKDKNEVSTNDSMGYRERRSYLDSRQDEDTASIRCSLEKNVSTPSSDQIILRRGNRGAAPQSMSYRQQNNRKNIVCDSLVSPVKNTRECYEKSVASDNKAELFTSSNNSNVDPNIAECGASGFSGKSGNCCENSDNLLMTKVETALTGAIPKGRKLLTTNKKGQGVLLSESEQLHNKRDISFPVEVGKGLDDLKNMTAEVGVNNSYINHSIGRDTGDNGTSFLNQIPPALLLATEKGRLKTYKNWSNKNIDPKKLAAAGFYYSGKTDIVECFRCGIKGHNWLENDKPMEDHMKWNKNCPFVRENTTEQDNAPQPRPSRDYCGNFGVDISPFSENEEPQSYCRNLGVEIIPYTEAGARTERSESPNLEKLGIRTTKGPSHPDHIIYENRLATFENWPKSLKQKPAELAAAGFYYLGIGDQTLCFYCGGGLKDWVEEDDPWEQHALWFPQCNYLLLKKTPAFVDEIQRKHKNNLSSKQDETEETTASCSTSKNAKEPPSAAVEEREKNNAEESSTLCKICYKNELGVVFLPCGHMVACVDCASGLKECAICRKDIQANVRAFLA